VGGANRGRFQAAYGSSPGWVSLPLSSAKAIAARSMQGCGFEKKKNINKK